MNDIACVQTEPVRHPVHGWIESFALGELRKIPSNSTLNDIRDYGASRFGYQFVALADNDIKRVCPCCGR